MVLLNQNTISHDACSLIFLLQLMGFQTPLVAFTVDVSEDAVFVC